MQQQAYFVPTSNFNGFQSASLFPQIQALSSTPLSTMLPPVPGCVLWLDAADSSTVIRSGSNVIQWNDKSGFNNFASNPNSVNQPRYITSSSGNYVAFSSATSQFLGFTDPNALASNTSFTIMMVEKRQSANSANYILGGTGTTNNTNLIIGYRTNTTVTIAFFGNDVNSTAIPGYNVSNEPTRVWAFDYSGTSRSIIATGTTIGSDGNTTNLISWVGGSIGRDRGNFYTGNIYEMLVYKPSLTTAQRQLIEGYLAWKWGVNTQLPISHPYFNTIYLSPLIPNFSTIVTGVTATFNQTFQPSQISGLGLWLDAGDVSTVILSNATVSQWNDKSGNGRNATGFSNPTYSSGSFINLNGTTQYFNVNLDFLAGVSHNAFIVLRNFNFANIYGAANPSLGANSLHIGFANNIVYRMNYWGNDYGPAITANYRTNQINMVNYVWINNTSKTIYANGRLEGTTNQPGVIGTMAGGGRIGNVVGQGLLNANLYEIIFYSNAITTAQRQQIEGYLAWKWGLQGQLPSGHPNQYMPP